LQLRPGHKGFVVSEWLRWYRELDANFRLCRALPDSEFSWVGQKIPGRFYRLRGLSGALDSQAGARVPRVPVVKIFRYDDEQIGAPLFYGARAQKLEPVPGVLEGKVATRAPANTYNVRKTSSFFQDLLLAGRFVPKNEQRIEGFHTAGSKAESFLAA